MNFEKTGYGVNQEEVNFWKNNRYKISDLYKSEKYFFEPIIQKVKSVVDIGCAAGGSLLFSRELNEDVSYTGLDVNEALISASQERFSGSKDAKFIKFDGEKLPLDENSSEFCFFFGVVHHVTHWKELIKESLRVSSRYVLFDIRVWENETIEDESVSYQKIALSGDWDGKTIISYNIVSYNEIIAFLREITSDTTSCQLYGYYAKPTHFAITPAKEVLMLSVLIDQQAEDGKISLLID